MLVHFFKSITLEGEATFTERKHFWSKPVEERKRIYVHTAVDGICDESEVPKEIDRLIYEKCATIKSCGKDFSGWHVYKQITDKKEAIITYINQWKMREIMHELTGEQFAQFCRENDIALKGDK
jgi:hypothetical protein